MGLGTTNHYGFTKGRPGVPRIADTNLDLIDEQLNRVEQLVFALPAIEKLTAMPFIVNGTARVPIAEIKVGPGLKLDYDENHNLTISLSPVEKTLEAIIAPAMDDKTITKWTKQDATALSKTSL